MSKSPLPLLPLLPFLLLVLVACGDNGAEGATTPPSSSSGASSGEASGSRTPASETVTADSSYFPAGIFHPDNENADTFVQQWYGKHLTAMGEPSLYEARGSDVEAYRFIHLPTWGHPVVVRIELRADDIEVTHRVLSGQGGYEPGELTTDATRVATPTELDAIRTALDAADFWDLSPRASMGADGEQWIIEAVRGDSYHLVDRWTPEPDGEHARFVSACDALRGLGTAVE